jgi:para-aminobenzoate synthetase component 1
VLEALPPEQAVAIVRDGPRTVVACGAEEVVRAEGEAAFAALDDLAPGFWVGWCTAELGHAVEHVVARTAAPDPFAAAAPAGAVFVRFAARAELDRDGAARVRGRGDGRRHLERALAGRAPVVRPGPPGLGGWISSLGRDRYEAGVRTVVELIRAGECYQANLTRRLATPEPADPIALWTAVASGNPAPHATFLRLGDRAIVSASPERYLRRDGARVETRPIKGTAADAAVLRASTKDRAENVMIVDLARNDLGRVCRPGSIHVPELCALERHPGLVHLVSTVRGELRPGTGLGALVRATFPPASVTGAPKPRVLQVIEDLEPVPRGVYCGALGWVDTERDRADLAVAIRTFTSGPEGSTFGVGAGITVDSDPAAEWAETELKAARLLALAAGDRRAPAPTMALGA